MRILLAEDEKRMAAALAALLKQEKYDADHTAFQRPRRIGAYAPASHNPNKSSCQYSINDISFNHRD